MGMGDRDATYAAPIVDFRSGFIVEESNAIPKQISSGRLLKQSALANRKFRFRSDAQKPRRFILEAIVMIRSEPFKCRPFLAHVTDELPFVFANWTMRRRFGSLSKLRSALHADKVFHRFRTLGCLST